MMMMKKFLEQIDLGLETKQRTDVVKLEDCSQMT